MRTFENFRKVVNESDYILSEAQRYLEILLEKDSEALKQYKASKKSFQKGFGKNIKPTVVQPGLDLYKAGGPFVPDKTTFADTGKKVPKMEKKPQFGTPKTTNKTGAPDRTLVKKAIKDVKDSERRLFQKGLGKGTAGVTGVKGKKGISLARQRAYTKEIIKDLSAKTTQSDARIRGASTEGSAGASSSSKTVTPTKGVKQSEVSKKAKDFTKEINQKRTSTTTSKTPLFSKVKPKGDGLVKNSKGIGNKYRGNSPEAIQLRKQAIAARGGGVVVKDKVTSSNRVNKGFKTGPELPNFNKNNKMVTKPVTKKSVGDILRQNKITGVTATGRPSRAKLPVIKDRALGVAAKKEFARNPNSPLLKKQNLRYLKAASKQKGIARGATRLLGKLGPKGRLAAAGLTAFFATPGGRNFAKNLLIGTGLTAALGFGGKKEKVLKKGDGLKTVGKVDVRYGLTGSSKKGQGGKIYNPKQMAQLGKVQKNFIDKYNQKAARNPFKKQIQYKPKADGTYKILDPKKK